MEELKGRTSARLASTADLSFAGFSLLQTPYQFLSPTRRERERKFQNSLQKTHSLPITQGTGSGMALLCSSQIPARKKGVCPFAVGCLPQLQTKASRVGAVGGDHTAGRAWGMEAAYVNRTDVFLGTESIKGHPGKRLAFPAFREEGAETVILG